MFRVRPDATAAAGEFRFAERMPRERTSSGIAFRNLVRVKGGYLVPGLEGVTVHLGRPFLRGDSDGSGTIDLAVAVRTLGYLFLEGARPACLDAADANDDGAVDVSDPIRVLDFLFLGGDALPPPGGVPALDPTPDALGC